MGYKITGWLEEPARVLVFKETDWSIEVNTSIDRGDFSISGLSAGKKMVAGRNSTGKVEVYGDITPLEYLAEDFLSINVSGDLLNINIAGDNLIIGIP